MRRNDPPLSHTGIHTWWVSLFRRRPPARSSESAPQDDDSRPSPARLYSEYISLRPSRDRPVDSANRAMSRSMFVDPLTESARNKLVVLLERNQPSVVVPGSRFTHVAHAMANIAIERMVAVRGDLSLRPSSGHPQLRPRPFDQLVGFVLEGGDCPLALDAVGAWATHTPGCRARHGSVTTRRSS
jgi:hypothetical protein